MGESGRRSSAAPATCAPLHNFCGGAICGNPKPSAALDGVLHASTTATWRRQQPAFGVVAIIAALDLLDGMRRRASAAVRLLGWCMIVGDGARFMGGGYVGDDEASAATMNSEGWLKTGDLCYFNEDGFLYIVDRSKELIKYKGYQVPPLEHILNSHPDIMDAAVIPYPDEDVGQLPMAFIVRNPGSNFTEQQVMDYMAKQVAN